jgi:hypothetical protein
VIHLHFSGPGSAPVTLAGPWFRVFGNYVRQGPHGASLGRAADTTDRTAMGLCLLVHYPDFMGK